MTSTPSIRTGNAGGQAPIAPDRMSLVEDWKASGGQRIELYADRKARDGYMIAIGPYGPEHAADIPDIDAVRDATPGPDCDAVGIEWVGGWADRPRPWRLDQWAKTHVELKAWSS